MTGCSVLRTLYSKHGAAVQVSDHGRVLSCVAAVDVLQDQFVSFPLRQNLAFLACLQLKAFEHPPDGDIVVRQAQLKGGGAVQQGFHVFNLLNNLDCCKDQ